MEADRTIPCPVCGRPNRNDQLCAFCGADLKGTPAAPSRSAGQTGYTPVESQQRQSDHSAPTQPPHPWAGPALGPRFAGFWIRTVAYVIDSILVGLAMRLLQFGYLKGSHQEFLGGSYLQLLDFDWSSLAPLAAAEVLVTFLYFTFFIGRSGQTPGKMICGLKVIRTDGGSVSYMQAALRTAGYYLNRFTLGLGFLWVAIDSRKQGFHDKIASTFVIRIGAADGSAWQQPPVPPSSYGPYGR